MAWDSIELNKIKSDEIEIWKISIGNIEEIETDQKYTQIAKGASVVFGGAARM